MRRSLEPEVSEASTQQVVVVAADVASRIRRAALIVAVFVTLLFFTAAAVSVNHRPPLRSSSCPPGTACGRKPSWLLDGSNGATALSAQPSCAAAGAASYKRWEQEQQSQRRLPADAQPSRADRISSAFVRGDLPLKFQPVSLADADNATPCIFFHPATALSTLNRCTESLQSSFVTVVLDLHPQGLLGVEQPGNPLWRSLDGRAEREQLSRSAALLRMVFRPAPAEQPGAASDDVMAAVHAVFESSVLAIGLNGFLLALGGALAPNGTAAVTPRDFDDFVFLTSKVVRATGYLDLHCLGMSAPSCFLQALRDKCPFWAK